MFVEYDKSDYLDLRKQHNIMVLVGNGFDIAALRKFGSGKMQGKTTSYCDFFDYITYYRFHNIGNVIYEKMEKDREENKENWADFENSISEIIRDSIIPTNKLEKDINNLTDCFARYLNDLVTADLLIEINNCSRSNRLASRSMSTFLADLKLAKEEKINFPDNTDHYDLYNYLFVNFNYTQLLDNYIYLDKTQFVPHPYRTVDRNFDFYPNPKDNITNCKHNQDRVWSSYLLADVIHPNGKQSIPRSIIFGIEDDFNKAAKEIRLVKSFWGQNDVKYKRLFDKTELFIIYGMSLSKTDSWWFNRIYNTLLYSNAELIIYYYDYYFDSEEVKERFLDACVGCERDYNNDEIVKSRIFIIKTDNDNNNFLGFRDIQV